LSIWGDLKDALRHLIAHGVRDVAGICNDLGQAVNQANTTILGGKLQGPDPRRFLNR